MNNSLDHLIPQQILDLLNSRHTKIQLVLTGQSAQGRYPCVSISVDGVSVKTVELIDTQTINYEFDAVNCNNFNLDIVYYNKTDKDTVVDKQGQIVENQNVTLNHVIVNDVDIVSSGIIHNIGSYTMNLSQEKYQYFLDNNINTEPTTSLSMHENGIWRINLGVPVWSFLTKKQQNNEIAEQRDMQPVLEEIYNSVISCKKLLGENCG